MATNTLPNDLKSLLNPQFRQQSLKQLNQLKPSHVVPFIHRPVTPNYTVVLRLDTVNIDSIQNIQNELKTIDSNHFYYPLTQLHLTLMGNINVNINPTNLISAIKKKVDTYNLEFVLFGLASNHLVASISAYPSFDISNLRRQLRQDINTLGEDYTIHLPTYEHMGWINFMRYLHTPKPELLTFLLHHSSTYFGTLKTTNIELYLTTSKVLDPNQSQLVWKSTELIT